MANRTGADLNAEFRNSLRGLPSQFGMDDDFGKEFGNMAGKVTTVVNKQARRFVLLAIFASLFNVGLLVGAVLGIAYGIKLIFFS